MDLEVQELINRLSDNPLFFRDFKNHNEIIRIRERCKKYNKTSYLSKKDRSENEVIRDSIHGIYPQYILESMGLGVNIDLPDYDFLCNDETRLELKTFSKKETFFRVYGNSLIENKKADFYLFFYRYGSYLIDEQELNWTLCMVFDNKTKQIIFKDTVLLENLHIII